MDRAGKSPEVGSASADAALGRAFAAIAPDAPFVIYQFRGRPDGSFHFPIVSSGFQSLFGVTPAEVAESWKPAFSRVHRDDQKALVDGILEASRTFAPWHGEFRVKSPAGEVWVEGRSIGRNEPDGGTLWFGVLFDITERKRIEEALRDSREAFSSILEATFDFYWEVDAEWRYTFISTKVTATLGYAPGELLGRTPFDFMSEAEAAEGRLILEEHARSRTPFVAEGLRRHKDGHAVALKSSGAPRFGQDGTLLGFRGVTRDVTEKRHAQQALRESEERLRAALQWQRQIFEGSRDAVFLSDEEGRFVAVNQAATELTGFSREELLAMTIPDLHEDPDLVAYNAFHGRILDGERILSEAPIRRRDGSKVAVEFNNSLVVIGGKRFVHTASRDVTERKRAAEALIASESRYRVLFENAAEGIVAIDPETRRFQFFNPSACAMFGYTPEEFGELTLADLHPREAVAQVLDKIRAAVDGSTQEMAPGVPCRKRDGTTFLADVHGSIVTLAGRKVAFGFFTDATARMRLEGQLRQAQKMEAVGQLAGGVAHDFNNLLTVISGNCELLLSNTPADDRRRDSLVDIRSAGERAASLTRQLLAFSRKQILEPKLVDVHEVVAGIEKMLRRLIGEDVDLQTDLAADSSWVKVDPGQLEQVVMNLVVNARDAMPRGGRILIRTRNVDPGATVDLEETEARERRPRVGISISDTGSGIPPEVKAHLFEPFFTTKAAGKGTGLGLATVYGIVKQSGGDVVVDSEPGKGATFTVVLPSQDSPREARGASGAHRALPRGTETVLVVEDEDSVRRIVTIALTSTGYRVIEARNGTEALELVSRHGGGIHVVVTDVVMPEMSGRELAERIAKEHPGVKVLFMSGYTDDAVMRHGIVEAGVAFLQKPFSPLALARKVREVLDGVG